MKRFFSSKPEFRSALRITAFLCFSLLCSCAPGRNDPSAQNITHPRENADSAALGNGTQNGTAQKTPERIVSLSPAVTEILFAIGAGDLVAGVTEYCDYPPEAKTKVSVGGFSGASVSVEQIRALRSDLVILSADMHGRIVSLLDDLGIASLAVEPHGFSEVYELIENLGALTGCREGAENVINGMKEKIAFAGKKITDAERPEIFWILGEDPLMSVGGGTFVSEAIHFAGGKNIFSDADEQWPLVSMEQVLLRKPEWIFVTDDMSGGPALLENPAWKNLPAVREGRVVLFNGDILYRYGPRLADAVVMISGILYPEAGLVPPAVEQGAAFRTDLPNL